MFFSISVDVNNINELYIADRKYQDILNVLNDHIEILESSKKSAEINLIFFLCTY